ncbi:MAG: NAD(P)/FAD-dependent oxidoreductase [Muribaculaceae bacterium]|nr:NAD(P)/FAD-dependent oxidoreductase [Roseburia sp.]MCM1430436.1 NAD(P)/FAD-dependent oxidoreductase [Muribaculaceae bacterium]MCM1492368.1 NAD(P)/FAD-dependent oxidoreductase [Muribaculaceae bacterium]
MSSVIVAGGGPAGMLAAYAAAEKGHKVSLIEQNEKLGKKLFITGKGRCNITNAGDMEELFAHVMSNRKFLYSAFYGFDNRQVIRFFEERGLRTKVERGNRVFPVSDHSSDVIAVLKRALERAGVEIFLNTRMERVLYESCPEPGRDSGGQAEKEKKRAGKSLRVSAVLTSRGRLPADAVIIATGGLSYPSTGSTGDGYRFAAESGHRLVECSPSLAPLETKEPWVSRLQGLSLKNTAIEIYCGGKKLYGDFGEMLFTHFGVSGPMILSASGSIPPEQFAKELTLVLDLKPALDMEQLDRRILKDFEEQKNRQFQNSLAKLLPAKLIPVMVTLSGIDPDKRVNEVTREERRGLVQLLKHLPLTVTGKRGWNEAIITKGGVSVRDVNPSTMESKLARGLYFCGEVLDLDALTGGYNLQIAWSTGHLAGCSVE